MNVDENNTIINISGFTVITILLILVNRLSGTKGT